MRSLIVLVGLVAIMATAHVRAEALDVMWGVQTAHQPTFKAAKESGKFACLDGKSLSEFDVKYVNDQFCDCDDGSDEPGTSACSFQVRFPATWRFQCHQAIGGKYKEIFHSRVNDGVCDCCDGSDEYDGNTECQNNCAEAALREEKEAAEREARRQAGLAAKKDLEQKGESMKTETAKQIAEAEAEVAAKDAQLAPLRTKKEAEEEEERKEREAIHQKSLKEKEIWEEEQKKIKEAAELKRQEEEAAALDKAREEADAAKTNTPLESQEAEDSERYVCSKWRQTKECKGDGERDETADKDCDEAIQGGWSGYCECFDSKEGVEVKHPFDCNHQMLTCGYVCAHNGVAALDDGAANNNNQEQKPEEPQFNVDDGSSHQRPEAQQARNEYDQVNNQKADAERRIADFKSTTDAPYYEYPALLALKDTCVSKDAGSYSYHLCMFKEIHQGPRGSTHHSGTLMGRFESFGEQTYASWGAKHDLTVQKYAHGQHCYSGPDRSVAVSVICGPTTELLSIDEPSMCTYKMVLQTPAVCE